MIAIELRGEQPVQPAIIHLANDLSREPKYDDDAYGGHSLAKMMLVV